MLYIQIIYTIYNYIYIQIYTNIYSNIYKYIPNWSSLVGTAKMKGVGGNPGQRGTFYG